jgi:hypothetical protein
MRVVNFALFEIDCDLVVFKFACAASDLGNFVFAQDYGEHTVFHAVIGEDVGERGRDEDAKTEILQRPHGMFPRRPTPEILSRHQNARARVAWIVEDERRVMLAIAGATPIVEQKLPKSCTLDPLQELFGNNLIGINIRSMQRCDPTLVSAQGFHVLPQ